MLIRNAEIHGRSRLDLRIEASHITEIGADLEARRGEEVLDAEGGALLPGLHDHHIHLFALAAAKASIRCGPPEVQNLDTLQAALHNAASAPAEASSRWLRGIGYHESVAGGLDRNLLDQLLPQRPLRIQHRSGAMWILNSAAISRLGLDAGCDAPGVERDARGHATGRLFRLDDWLREQLGKQGPPPCLSTASRDLARCGVTGLTDATVHNGPKELAAFATAIVRGELRQRLVMMGSLDLPAPEHPRIALGAVKILLDENELPSFKELHTQIAESHARARPVAIHCVTRSELVLAIEALRSAGTLPGDRIEHASVAPPDLIALLQELPLTVVTQPHFIRERGDTYLRAVEPTDHPWLYRCRGFLDAGIPLGCGSDAPFGSPDPWWAMRAAVERRTETGTVIGPREGLTPEQALALFTADPQTPGGPPRPLTVGQPADLCLLDRPWTEARRDLSCKFVRIALRDGEPIWIAHSPYS